MSETYPEQATGDQLMEIVTLFDHDVTLEERETFIQSLSPEARGIFSRIVKEKKDWVIIVDQVNARDLQRYRNYAEFSRLHAKTKHADAGIKQFLEAYDLWLSLMRGESKETLRFAA